MKQTMKMAYGGIMAALSVALMFTSSFLPFLVYAVPAAAGIIVMQFVIEFGCKWAALLFCTVSVLSAILVPNKEAAAMYIVLFGYYPILKSVLDALPKVLRIILKLILFNVTVFVAYYVMITVFGISAELLEDITKFTVPILLVVGSVAFMVYDMALSSLAYRYIKVWHKQFKKMFKFK